MPPLSFSIPATSRIHSLLFFIELHRHFLIERTYAVSVSAGAEAVKAAAGKYIFIILNFLHSNGLPCVILKVSSSFSYNKLFESCFLIVPFQVLDDRNSN